MIDRKKIENLVREKLINILNKFNYNSDNTTPSQKEEVFDFVNEKVIRECSKKYINITPSAIITPSARDLASSLGIEFKISLSKNIKFSDEKFTPNTIIIGSDHGGYKLKEEIKKYLQELKCDILDIGTYDENPVDYPDIALAVAKPISEGKCRRGIIVDGVGIGSAIVANKLKGVRAAHCHNIFEVKNAREHNDSNILTLGGRVIGVNLALEMVKIWLGTPFAGGRHKRRVDKIIEIEKEIL